MIVELKVYTFLMLMNSATKPKDSKGLMDMAVLESWSWASGSGFRGLGLTLWFLVGNGGLDPYDSPLRSPIVVPITHSPIPY